MMETITEIMISMTTMMMIMTANYEFFRVIDYVDCCVLWDITQYNLV
jgi:hypothetical protein